MAELVDGSIFVEDLVDLGGHSPAERVGRDISVRRDVGVLIEWRTWHRQARTLVEQCQYVASGEASVDAVRRLLQPAWAQDR